MFEVLTIFNIYHGTLDDLKAFFFGSILHLLEANKHLRYLLSEVLMLRETSVLSNIN